MAGDEPLNFLCPGHCVQNAFKRANLHVHSQCGTAAAALGHVLLIAGRFVEQSDGIGYGLAEW